MGNILVQMLYGGEFLSLDKGRRCIRRSFKIQSEKIRQKPEEERRKAEKGNNKKKIQLGKRL